MIREDPMAPHCRQHHQEKENVGVVKELLPEQGAGVNAQGGYHGNAVQAACASGH